MPRSASAPIEPYLNRSASLANCCSGSSRKNLFQVNQAANPPRTTSATSMMRSFRFFRGVRLISGLLLFGDFRSAGRSGRKLRLRAEVYVSKPFQIFDDGVLLFGAEMRTVFRAFVPVVSVAREPGVVAEKLPPILFRDITDEADALWVVYVVAAVKLFRALLRWLEQIAQRRRRAVVQVRRTQPDAVQRLVRVAEGLAKVRETLVAIARVKKILVHAEIERVAVEPPAVGLDVSDRRDFTDTFAVEVRVTAFGA